MDENKKTRKVLNVIDILATRQCARYELQSTPSLLFLWLRCANMQHNEPSTSVTLTHPQKETHNQEKEKKSNATEVCDIGWSRLSATLLRRAGERARSDMPDGLNSPHVVCNPFRTAL